MLIATVTMFETKPNMAKVWLIMQIEKNNKVAMLIEILTFASAFTSSAFGCVIILHILK